MNSSNLISYNPSFDSPSLQELYQATSEFSLWIKAVTPGAIPFVCGGLALAMHGNTRSTTDADLAIDLSRTCRPNSNRPYDTNALKSLAAMNPDKFIVGPKIYWIINAGTDQAKPVQVDFVDANLYWAPFEAEAMVDFSSKYIAHPLNLRTLLVSKMRSAIERSQPNVQERFTKQSNDVRDFQFALKQTVKAKSPLATIHLQQLGSDESSRLATIKAFWTLVHYLFQYATIEPEVISSMKQQWTVLIGGSRLSEQYIQGA